MHGKDGLSVSAILRAAGVVDGKHLSALHSSGMTTMIDTDERRLQKQLLEQASVLAETSKRMCECANMLGQGTHLKGEVEWMLEALEMLEDKCADTYQLVKFVLDQPTAEDKLRHPSMA